MIHPPLSIVYYQCDWPCAHIWPTSIGTAWGHCGYCGNKPTNATTREAWERQEEGRQDGE